MQEFHNTIAVILHLWTKKLYHRLIIHINISSEEVLTKCNLIVPGHGRFQTVIAFLLFMVFDIHTICTSIDAYTVSTFLLLTKLNLYLPL